MYFGMGTCIVAVLPVGIVTSIVKCLLTLHVACTASVRGCTPLQGFPNSLTLFGTEHWCSPRHRCCTTDRELAAVQLKIEKLSQDPLGVPNEAKSILNMKLSGSLHERFALSCGPAVPHVVGLARLQEDASMPLDVTMLAAAPVKFPSPPTTQQTNEYKRVYMYTHGMLYCVVQDHCFFLCHKCMQNEYTQIEWCCRFLNDIGCGTIERKTEHRGNTALCIRLKWF